MEQEKRVGEYRLLNQIGKSQHGVSFLAQPVGVERLITLRMYPSQFLTHTDFMEHFLIEAEAIKMLSHPHIARIYTYGQVEKFPFIARRYIDGESLQVRLKKGSVPIFKIEEPFHNLCLALEYAHEQGVVHGHIHPNNIVFDKDDKVYLTDFGISAIKNNPFIKSPYHAPELTQSRPADVKSDIYSLGMILFEWITGKLPSWSDSILSTRDKALPSVRIYHPTAYPLLDEVIARATSSDPDLRYPSVKEFFRAYIKAVNNKPIIVENRPYLVNDDSEKATSPAWLNVIGMVLAAVFVFLAMSRVFGNPFLDNQDNNPNNNYVYQPAIIPDGYVLYSSDKIEMAVPSWWENLNTEQYRLLLSMGLNQLDGEVSPELYDFIQESRSEIESFSYEIAAIDFSYGTNATIRALPSGYVEPREFMAQMPSEMRQYGIDIIETRIVQLPVGEAIYARGYLQIPDMPILHMYIIQMNRKTYQVTFTEKTPSDPALFQVMINTFRIK